MGLSSFLFPLSPFVFYASHPTFQKPKDVISSWNTFCFWFPTYVFKDVLFAVPCVYLVLCSSTYKFCCFSYCLHFAYTSEEQLQCLCLPLWSLLFLHTYVKYIHMLCLPMPSQCYKTITHVVAYINLICLYLWSR